MTVTKLAALVLFTVTLAQAPPARAALCYRDATKDGKGVPIKWLTMPIPYYINASRLPASLQASAINAVQAAFSAWELPCTKLKFKYQGTSTALGSVSGAILVYWGNDASSWPYGQAAFWYDFHYKSYTTGEIDSGSIGMNARDYGWAVGPVAGKIDIQTLVMQVMPGALGFYVGPSPTTGTLSVQYNYVNTTLTQEHIDGARFLYFAATPGCIQPATPQPCATWKPPFDGGPPADAKALLDGPRPDSGPAPADAAREQKGAAGDATALDQPAVGDVLLVDQAPTDGATSREGAPPPVAEDSGCGCHAGGHAREWPLLLTGLALLAAALLLLGGRRRAVR